MAQHDGPDTVQALVPFATTAGGTAPRIIKRGDVYPTDHPVVRANPTRFGQIAVAGVRPPMTGPGPRIPARVGVPEPAAPAATVTDDDDSTPTPPADDTAATGVQDGQAATTGPDEGSEAIDAAKPDPTTASADDLVAGYTRAELNAIAAAAGVDGADGLANKAAVADAIVAARKA